MNGSGQMVDEEHNNKEPRWYAVQTYSGHEGKVYARFQKLIEHEADTRGDIRQVLIPTEEGGEGL